MSFSEEIKQAYTHNGESFILGIAMQDGKAVTDTLVKMPGLLLNSQKQ